MANINDIARRIVTNNPNEGFSIAKAEEFIKVFLEEIIDIVATGEVVSLNNFGKMEPAIRAAKNGINPRTKEPIQIPEARVVRFKPSKRFKEAL